ncbi:hypothetical protein C8R46DRAFT_1035057 [Mycena filopes]|nr:hypothetical protein C8R46DRAFT_1035057 [Mycena filopes]
MSVAAVFPAELEREIFETAATREPSSIPRLLLVAHRVHIWLEPLLYRVVSVKQRGPIIQAILDSRKPPVFFQNAVRHLAFPYGAVMGPEAQRILGLCTGVVNLACEEMYCNPSLLRSLEGMYVQRLTVYVTRLFENSPVDFTHRAFSSVTHLDMFEDSEDDDLLHLLSLIPTCPVLTHLGVDYRTPRNHVLDVLAKCPQLQLLIVLWPPWGPHEYAAAKTASVLDVRFVIGTYDNFWAEWEAGARGFPDFWSRGDDFVARKRKGKIEATRYWMD